MCETGHLILRAWFWNHICVYGFDRTCVNLHMSYAMYMYSNSCIYPQLVILSMETYGSATNTIVLIGVTLRMYIFFYIIKNVICRKRISIHWCTRTLIMRHMAISKVIFFSLISYAQLCWNICYFPQVFWVIEAIVWFAIYIWCLHTALWGFLLHWKGFFHRFTY